MAFPEGTTQIAFQVPFPSLHSSVPVHKMHQGGRWTLADPVVLFLSSRLSHY